MSNPRCLVAHPKNVWTPARLVSKDGLNFNVLTDEGENVIGKEATPKEPATYLEISETSLNSVEDLCTLEELHAGLILEHLRMRFLNDDIYTYIGPMVVSVNPFQKLLNIAGPEGISDYLAKEKEDLPPHLYHIGKKAFQSMCAFKESQSVIISGESGAGKTEATKIVLKFLTVASGSAKTANQQDIAQMILATNPILEAFGNAKTTRNNNSSRFGKFIKILFSGTTICGAQIDNYLLEKTRIVFQAPTERNYHVFYQLIAGASEEDRKKYRLRDSPSAYACLTNGDIRVTDIEDKEWWADTMDAFQQVGFTELEVDSIKRILSGLLLLGNVDFNGDEKVSVKDQSVLDELTEVFMIQAKGLAKTALESRQFTVTGRKTIYNVPLTYQQAIENRNALAKAIYSGLFDWLVQKLNKQLSSGIPEERFIGVLDIYGFEIFEKNSLEQFCINYANEKLHQQFNHHMFKAEQEEYKKEGIEWKDVNYKDNIMTISLIEKHPGGIITLLDEECKIPKGSDEGFLLRIDQQHSRNQSFAHRAQDKDEFTIRHFAGNVAYKISGFLDKNKDTLNQDFVSLMVSSEDPVLRSIFEAKSDSPPADTSANNTNSKAEPTTAAKTPIRGRPQPGSGPTGRPQSGNYTGQTTSAAQKVSVTSNFRQDLTKLVATLSASERHYVRCIKPNDTKKGREWEAKKVFEQLSCNGVLETVAVRKSGFANRVPFEKFVLRFSMLLKDRGCAENAEGIKLFFQQFLPGGDQQGEWACGLTKFFFRDSVLKELQKAVEALYESSCIVLQSCIRQHNAIVKYQELVRRNEASKKIQCVIRQNKARAELDYLLLRRAWAIRVQAKARQNVAIVALHWHVCTRTFQKLIRRLAAQQIMEELRRQRAALRIQCKLRQNVALVILDDLQRKEACRRIQCRVRQVAAMDTLAELQRRNGAAMRIQCMARRNYARAELQLHVASRAVQCLYRRCVAIEDFEELVCRNTAAIVIQCLIRQEAAIYALEQLEEAEAERLRLEAEEAERQRLAEEERLRLEAEEKERQRLAEQERLRKEAEAAELRRQQLAREEQERLQREAEEAERQRLQDEADRVERERLAELKRQQEEQERLEREAAAEAERIRLEELAEDERLRIEEENEMRRKEAEQAEMRRKYQEKIEAEQRKKAAELAEKQRLEEEQKQQQLAAERQLAEQQELARQKQQADEQAQALAKQKAQADEAAAMKKRVDEELALKKKQMAEEEAARLKQMQEDMRRNLDEQKAKLEAEQEARKQQLLAQQKSIEEAKLAEQQQKQALFIQQQQIEMQKKQQELEAQKLKLQQQELEQKQKLLEQQRQQQELLMKQQEIARQKQALEQQRLAQQQKELEFQKQQQQLKQQQIKQQAELKSIQQRTHQQSIEQQKLEMQQKQLDTAQKNGSSQHVAPVTPISLSVEHINTGGNRNRLRSRKMSRAVKVEIEKAAVCNGARLSNGRLMSEANSELLSNDLARARMSNLTSRRVSLAQAQAADNALKTNSRKSQRANNQPNPDLFRSPDANPPETQTTALAQPDGKELETNTAQSKIRVGIVRGNIIARKEARAVGGLLSENFDMYLRVGKKNTPKFHTIVPTQPCKNTFPLKPTFVRGETAMPALFDILVNANSIVTIDVFEKSTFSDKLIGSMEISVNGFNLLGNGEHWVQLKHEQVHCAGELLMTVSGLADHDFQPPIWYIDELTPGCEATKIALKKDYDPGECEATLVRSQTTDTPAKVAVLYIPTFSDYFWNDELMELFKDEGYQFYALELRRYGRSLHLDQGHHPNLCFEVCEYYEEIGKAIHIMRIFDGIEKVLLFGHGSGAIIAANYINDHNELVDGFLAISPLVMLHTAFPGFDKPFFHNPLTTTPPSLEAYHKCIHRDFLGDRDWDMKLKPMSGFPLYCGWIDALNIAIERMKNPPGIHIESPVLVLSSQSTSITTKPSPDLLKKDAIVSVSEIAKVTAKWGNSVKCKQLKDAFHDVLLSSTIVTDGAYNEIFSFFEGFFEDEYGGEYHVPDAINLDMSHVGDAGEMPAIEQSGEPSMGFIDGQALDAEDGLDDILGGMLG